MMNANKNIVVDEDFKALIPPLSQEEYENLEQDIIANGCIVPLILWQQDDGSFILIDGHNRYEICKKHNIGFKANVKNFSSKSEALLQIINLQLGRRNLSAYARTELALKYEEILSGQARKAQAEAGRNTSQKLKEQREQVMNETSVDNNDSDIVSEEESKEVDAVSDVEHSVDTEPLTDIEDEADAVDIEEHSKKPDANARKTASKIGEMAGVSRDTVNKVKKIQEKASEDTKEKLRKNEISINQAEKIISLPEEERIDAEQRLASGEQVKDVIKSLSSIVNKEDELYTPKEYTDAAVNVMGSIDLDPASCDEADDGIDATCYFTKADDGLGKSWNGNIWLNPPRSADKIDDFINKLIFEIEDDNHVKQACVLVDARTATDWFQDLVRVSSVIMFPRDYIKYRLQNNSSMIRTEGQAVFYIGQNIDEFVTEFGKWGMCVFSHQEAEI